MLSVINRQKYLNAIGINIGSVDGIEGPKTKAGYLTLQKKYFTRSKDIDGIYGLNTDILLQSAYNMKDIKYFKLSEMKCQCGGKYCTGYPAIINKQLMKNIDYLRNDSGSAITITSGLRCSTHNRNVGGASGSYHTKGRAVDIVSNVLTSTKSKRKQLVKRWNTFKKNHYAYSDSSNMGNAVHLDVYD